MKKMLSIALLVSSASAACADQSVVTVSDFPHETLSPLAILQEWPVCSFTSSLGQICRAYWGDETPNGFLDVLVGGRLTEGHPKIFVEISETVLDVTVEGEWFYSFTLDQTGANEFQVVFTDDSLMGSYLTQTEYTVTMQDGVMIVTEGTTQTW